ncbi:MAG: S8 family serine peptidase [Promethearchaeota archaeon]
MISRINKKTKQGLFKTLVTALVLMSLFISSFQGNNNNRSLNYPDNKFKSTSSPFIDANLQVELERGYKNEQIKAWFLFQDDNDKTTWLQCHDLINYENHDINHGILITDTKNTIYNLLYLDQSSVLIKSAWLEREIQTGIRDFRSSEFINKNNAPSEPSSISWLNISKFRAEKNLDGRGTIIGLLSTGIGFHEDLKHVYNSSGDAVSIKVIANVSFVDWDPLYVDVNGEGTFLAGIIAGTGNASGGQFVGIAPGAQLINAKCVDFMGITLWQWAISGIEFSYSHGADIIVAGWNIIGYPGDPLTTAIDEITKKGVLVISATGDLGPSYMTINTPGMASSAVTAGAINTTENGDITLANFSSRGSTLELKGKPDLLAPGVNITSCLTDLNFSGMISYETLPINVTPSFGQTLPSNPNYTTASTTGAAAAFVAGVASLLIQDFKFARPEIIKDALIRTAHDLNLNSNAQGAGITDIFSAWNYLKEHQSRMPESRSFTPAMPYAGFIPNYEFGATSNKTSLYFISNYGTVNFFTHLVQNITTVPDRNFTHLLQGMFGLYHDDKFSFMMMDDVYREMHITHYGNFSRALSIINHQDKLLIIITAETWRDSLETMRLKFNIINMGNETINNLSIHSWWKADLNVSDDFNTIGMNESGGYLTSQDILYVNDTTNDTQSENSSFFMFKASSHSAGHAIGGLSDTMAWIQNDNLTFNGSQSNDSIDNTTLAAKYTLASALHPGENVSINFSIGCGLNFTTLANMTNFTLSGYDEPEIRDISVVKVEHYRMYEVNKIITTSAIIINTGNAVVNDTQVILSINRVLENSTESHLETWNAGDLEPLKILRYKTTFVSTYEGMYSLSWMAADQQTIQNILFNVESLGDINLNDINFTDFNITEINWQNLTWSNGSIGSTFLGNGSEANPLDNIFLRDIFIYTPDKMFIHENTLMEDLSLTTPRPYAGFTPRNPISAPMKPEFIGDYALVNITLYSSVTLTNLTVDIEGNASVSIVENMDDLASMMKGNNANTPSLPTNATTGMTLLLFIDASLLKFPMNGTYISTLTFNSDQGFIDKVIINYTIDYPRAKILFDTQHNDLLNILTGDQRDMIMGSYYQMYEDLKRFNYDVDEYIIFNNYTEMDIEGMNLFNFYDAIIIADPEIEFAPEEIDILLEYYNSGGKIIILGDADGGTGSFMSSFGNNESGSMSGDFSSFDNLDIGNNMSFDYDFNSIKKLISGAGILPDGCNISGLSNLINIFGFHFNQSTFNKTMISNFNTSHPITENFTNASIDIDGYTTFYISGNFSENTPLAWDADGNLVAAINENKSTGGAVVLISDSNFVDAYHLESSNNSDFIADIARYLLKNELSININLSRPSIHLGENLFIEAEIDAKYNNINPENLISIVAFVHLETGEKVMSQFLHTEDDYFVTFLISDGLDLMGYFFPPLNYTGTYYIVAIFNDPSVTGLYHEMTFQVLPRLNNTGTEWQPPILQVYLEGLIIVSATTSLIVLIYFNARRKQEQSMSVPELDEKMVQNIENVFMELQSRITIVSEEILYSKSDDFKTRIKNIKDKINLLNKSIKKMKKYEKHMSRF